jgi:hypothetical protein
MNFWMTVTYLYNWSLAYLSPLIYESRLVNKSLSQGRDQLLMLAFGNTRNIMVSKIRNKGINGPHLIWK